MRSAVAWATAASRYQSAERVIDALTAAGFNLEAVRDELESLARSRIVGSDSTGT